MDTDFSLEALEKIVGKYETEWSERKGKQDLLLEQLHEVEKDWQLYQEEKELLDQVRILFQKASDYARQQAKAQLELLVTRALQMVFGPAFSFVIELSEAGKNPSAEFFVVTDWDGMQVKNKPQDSRGGGIVDIISLALRIALITTIQPRVEGPLILDEPGKHVSKDYVVPMVQFLQLISQTYGRQIILVTHNSDLTESADQVYEVRLNGGKSELVLLTSP
ncbi:DNA repair exonuclease SbcCD ATPase subunit [Croceifilum oryzae]|uniref:DNA repair exonuclease SbcCD ATPase subunit n=1 Tax=Croceifilum oryzae TaxID=1553429 RepID=A0AAJ1TJ44_9BACL|nr:ATP-binding protein [Croceifilum oryzae]MDQ0416929.1 DNA repair exonuclease SbcCD ATPase subunit [Croceifilum oryzae]